MKKIGHSTNTANAGGEWTEGNPGAGVGATLIKADWLNTVQRELVAVVEGVGLALDPTKDNQVVTAIRSISGAPAGAVNAKMSVTAASQTATFTADEVVVKTENGGQAWVLKNFSKTVNLAVTGPGGIDVGPVPTSGFIGIYAIYNPTSNTSALLAVNGNFFLPNVYPAFNLTSGYAASALVSVWPVNGVAQFMPAYQEDRSVTFLRIGVLSATALAGSLTSLAIGGAVPRNAKTVSGSAMLGASSGTGGLSMQLAADANGMGLQVFGGYVSTNQGVPGTFIDLPLITKQALFHRETNSQSTAGFTVDIFVSGYKI
ncbi:hypothetical protein [Pseudomonas sp. MRSN 12121]|uniref:hypothetical protein n=1 Tax=Pseudomonas sp. MRSN 12121 TaxID=1611770 RepID=UPI000A5EE01D|nr:hypothetical protein [Pseudomonas sp. MRSN 12121]